MPTHMNPHIFILPGLYNSGPEHWQSIWETTLPNAVRVQQQSWNTPNKNDWVSKLNSVIENTPGPIILAAHSLGCATVAWWAAEYGQTQHAARVKGALLVAPPDVEHADFPQAVTGFAPMPSIALPFTTMVAASSNDVWCALPRAQAWAKKWGAAFHDVGPLNHINGESGLDDWPQGRAWLKALAEQAA